MGVGRAFCIAIVVLIATACGRIGYLVAKRDASSAADASFDARDAHRTDDVEFDALDASSDLRDADRLRDAEIDALDASSDATDADRLRDADIDAFDTSMADAAFADSGATDANAADAEPTRVLNAVRVFAPPGLNFRPSAIATDLDGNVYLAATTVAAQDFGGGPVPAGALVLASYDSTGALRWQRVLPATAGISATRVSTIGNGVTGTVLVTGSIEGTVTVPSSGSLSAPAVTWMQYSVSTGGAHRFANIYPGASQSIGQLAADGTIDVAGFQGTVDLGLGARAGKVHVARFDTASTATMHQVIAWSGAGFAGPQTPVRFGPNTLVGVTATGLLDFGAGSVGSGTLTAWAFLAEYTPAGVYLSHREFSVGETPFANAFIRAVVAENDIRCSVVSYSGTPISFSAPSGEGTFVECQHSSGPGSWSAPFVAATAQLYGSRLVLAGSFAGVLDLPGAGLFDAGGSRDTLVVTYEIPSGRLIGATRIESRASDDFPISIAIDTGMVRLWVLADYEGMIDLNGTLYDSGTRDHAWLAWIALPP